jgi:DNA-binding winged helix-turn-helix (wHTH) protein
MVPTDVAQLRFGSFEVDLRARRLWSGGTRVRLQPQVFELLLCLLERPGELLDRNELCARLWPDGTFVDFEHGLNTAVRKLRRALGDSAESPRYVETVVGRGYRFLGSVETLAPARVADSARPDPPLERRPFVGRDTELGALLARLAEAWNGRGAFVLLTEESGIGKTLTLEEFADRARREGVVVPTRDALTQVLAALAERAPIVLLLDDAHWADPGTIAVVLNVTAALRQLLS